MSPHTTHPPQNPPKASKKQDATVDEPSTDPKIAMAKIFGGLKNYKHKKSLEDLDILGMTVKEFWQHGDKDYTEFEYENPFALKYVHVKSPFIM
jgi:hypothetical protein